jgi:ribonuclease J
MNKLSILPIGGLGEFGMNSMALRYGEESIVIDAGVMFPDVNHWGIDVIVPDFNNLATQAGKVRALVLTHSHEDHIGAVPHLLKKINLPIYGTPYTLAVLAHKLDEHNLLDKVELHTVAAGQSVEIGPFQIEFIRVAHSTTDCVALAVNTPLGTIVHTGDFKFDDTPVCGEPTDIAALRRCGDRGVLALLTDSTNIERSGRMHSERAVIPGLEQVFDAAEGRILVSCFTSSIHRLQIIFQLAAAFQRKIAVIGRSMIRNVETAESMRYLDIPPNLIVAPNNLRRYAPEDLVLLATGCQGEPLSALYRMAVDSYKQIRVEAGDTVVLSARQIPGNEKSIGRLINNIYRRQGRVVDSTQARIHVSGHAAQEDLRMMLEAVRPRYYVPIHGEYRQLYQHGQFIQQLGYSAEQIVLAETGEVIEIDEAGISFGARIKWGRVYIDNNGVDEIDAEIIRERKQLAAEGVVLPIVLLDKQTHDLQGQPRVITRGLNVPQSGKNDEDNQWYINKLRELIVETVVFADRETRRDIEVLKEKIRIDLKRTIQRDTGHRPAIMPTIVEV